MKASQHKQCLKDKDSTYCSLSLDSSELQTGQSGEKLSIRNISYEKMEKMYIDYCIAVNKESDEKEVSEKEKHKLMKRCETCFDFINREYLLYCQFCLDAYHSYCLSPPKYNLPRNKESITCPKCVEDEMKSKRQRKGSESNRSICQGCHKQVIYMKTRLTCEKCKIVYHSHCFKREHATEAVDRIICDSCEQDILDSLKTLKIADYFQGSGPSDTELKPKTKSRRKTKVKDTEVDIMLKLSNNSSFKSYLSKKRNRYKNEGKLKLPKSLSKKQKEKNQKSLYRALTVKSIVFSDDLVYLDNDCPIQCNNSFFEPSIQKMSAYNTKIFKQFKKQSRKGEYGPVQVIDDSIQKFVVQATDDIVMNTIICEYAGEVTLLRKKLFADNDSIMDLIRTPSSSTSLVICPERYGNLARFLSGINNSNPQLKKKQNVYSLRVNIDQSIRIFLLAAKNIKKGEVLYYDYNAGGYNGYPTDRFV